MILSVVMFSFVLSSCSSCNAAGVKPQASNGEFVKGEFIVLFDNKAVSIEHAKQKIQALFEEAKVDMISKNVAHIIFSENTDPGLENVRKALLKFKWIKSVEPNRIAHISV